MQTLTKHLLSCLVAVFGVQLGLAQSTGAFRAVNVDVPPKVSSSFFLSHADPGKKLSVVVSMPYGDPVGMKNFVDSVSNPNSPDYRKFLLPEEVGQKFGLPLQKVNSVSNYLASQGFRVTLVSKNHLAVVAEGTVAQAESAFGTTINRYWYTAPAGKGEEFFSYSTKLSVPAEIAPMVLHVSGLDSAEKPQPRSFSATQARSLYSLSNSFIGGNQGLGRTVAISNFDGFDLSNIPLYYTKMNLPHPSGGVGSNVTVVTIGNGSQNGPAQAEGDLDIQMVLGMAPLCNLVVYDGGGPDMLNVLTQEVNDNIADVISESYGWQLNSPSSANAAHNQHLSMSAQGITYMAASGDSGTNLEPFSYPNYDPEVLMVGGTVASIDTFGARTEEQGWSGSGGGWCTDAVASAVVWNVLPSYQVGKGVPTNRNFRLSPDLAFHAGGTGAYEFFLNGMLSTGFDGTSFASPLFAGALATCEANIIAGGGLPPDAHGKRRFGRIQDLIYSQNGRSDVWFDVTSGQNGVLPDFTTSSAGVGWDFVTGWGPMNFDAFVNTQLSIVTLSSLTVNPGIVVGGLKSTGTVTVAIAPKADATISLASSNANVKVPASVTIPAGSTSANFDVTTLTVTTSATATITASVGNSKKTANLTVTPPRVSSISFSPSTFAGGGSTIGTVTLNANAPSGGTSVGLTDNSSSATVPSAVTVPAGSKIATFNVATTGVSANTTVSVTATTGGASVVGTFSLTPPAVSGITFNPASVTGGLPCTGTASISGVAPASGFSVALSSSNSAVKVPAKVTIPAGKTSVTFSVTTSPVASDVSGTVNATANAVTVQSGLTVLAPRVLKVTTTLASVVGGTPLSGTITLTSKAPPNGVTVQLTKNNSSANIGATVKVAASATTATFQITTMGVQNDTPFTVTASLNGASASVTVLVTAPKVSALKLSATTIKGGKPLVATVTLASVAPTGGLTIPLTSSNTAVLPASVVVPAGSKIGSVSLTTTPVLSDVSVTVTATKGASSAKATVKVLAPIAKLAVSPTTVKAGGSVTGTLTLDGPAPAGFVWVVASIGPVTVPSSVTFTAGTTTATFKVNASAVQKSTAATINVSRNAIKLTGKVTVTP